MSMRKLCWATGFLWFLTIGVNGVPASEGPSEASPRVIEITGCTIRFVNKSTYATARPGIIAEIPFEEGDRVPANQLIVRLRDEVAEAQFKLRTRQAAIKTAVLIAQKEELAASMELADKMKANSIYRTSFPGDDEALPIPESEIKRLRVISEARELQVQQAREEVELNEVAVQEAQAELDTYRVYAEFGGLVTRLNKHVGEAVNLGDEIITVVDTSRVRVEGTLPYSEARQLQVGDPVYVQLALPEAFDSRTNVTFDNTFEPAGAPNETVAARRQLPEEKEVFTGRIGFIDVETQGDTGIVNEVRVWAEVANRDNILLEGLPAEMKVHVRGR